MAYGAPKLRRDKGDSTAVTPDPKRPATGSGAGLMFPVDEIIPAIYPARQVFFSKGGFFEGVRATLPPWREQNDCSHCRAELHSLIAVLALASGPEESFFRKLPCGGVISSHC